MEHIGIGHDDLPRLSHFRPDRRGRVAVIGIRQDRLLGLFNQIVQIAFLVLRQSLCRKQVQGACIRVIQYFMQHRQMVAIRFAGSGRRDGCERITGLRQVERLPLMGIQLFDAFLAQCLFQAIVHRFRKIGIACRFFRLRMPMVNALHHLRLHFPFCEDFRYRLFDSHCFSSPFSSIAVSKVCIVY